jgi:N-acetylglucosamine kinase-like BadF-type ATPase
MVSENRPKLLGKFPDGRPALLAVDGGASKIDVALVRADGSVLAAARHKAFANFNYGHEPPLDALDEAIHRAADAAGMDGQAGPVAVTGVFCLAGADLPLDDRRIGRLVRGRGWAKTVLVRNDTFAVLRAGSRRGWGVAVVCGSGLNCAGVGPDGRVIRFPSLGELSGDLAHGGGWLGRAALGAALRARDGRGPRTSLERLVPEHFRMTRPAAVMEAVYIGRLDPQRLLEVAPVVFGAAAKGDEVARALIDAMADEIVATANAAIRRLRLTQREFEVILGGGIFRSHDGRLMRRVRDGILAIAPRAELHRLDAPPVLGAALMGLDEVHASAAAKKRATAELTNRKLKV